MQADTPTAIPAEAPNARAAESAAAYQRSLERARQQAEDAASGKLGNGGGSRRENRPAQSQADLPLNPPEPEGGKADPSQEQSRTERDSGS